MGRKELALFAYLARRAPRRIPRAELATLLWGERREAQARQSLRQALVRLRRAVAIRLETETESVALLPGGWEFDVAAFEADLAAGRLPEAVERWEGDFLAGAEDVGGEAYRYWVEVEREALRQRVGPALERLVADAEQAGDWNAAVRWAERWALAWPLDQRAHRRLIEVLRLAGRPHNALAAHATFVARLRGDFGLEPSSDLLRLGGELAQHAPAARRPRPTPGSRALFTPDFVGRATPFGELSACWTAVSRGTGAVVLVDGDEGVGKTRFCEEFLRSLPAAGDGAPLVLRARGHEAARDVPWAVARELLAPLRDAPGVPGASPGALAALGRLVPAIRERFPPAATVAQAEWSPDEAVAEVLAAAAADNPVVVFVDDLPSADASTQQLMLSLIRRGLAKRVLLLLAARADDLERSPRLGELRAGGGHRLRLQTLRETDVEALLGSMLDLPPADRRRLSERLLAETGGNPFQMIQITAALLDEGYLAPDAGGTWRFATLPADQPFPVPPSVRDAVGRRLALLDARARRLAEAAAVLAGPAGRNVLREVSDLSMASFDSALGELMGRRLLRASPGHGDSYEYAHEVSRRVVYDQLPKPEREALHGAALTSLRTRAASDAGARAARQYHRARAGSSASRLVAWTRSRRALVTIGALAASAALALGVGLSRRPAAGPAILAVGAITDHTGAAGEELTGVVQDLLATNLARVPGVQIVGTARLYELLGQLGRVTDSSAAMARAARQAGAMELVEGALYRAPDGGLRLDLRRMRLRDGAILAAYSVVGREPFALVDSATSQLVSRLEVRTPVLRVADVTTSSLVAHRFYQEGLRLYYQGDARSAQRMFHTALAEDSTFAMAAYYVAMTERALGEDTPRASLIRAARLADHATDRERLLILAMRALISLDPAASGTAESLATRYPSEPDGHLLWARVLTARADFVGAIPHFRRVVDMDSQAIRAGAVLCRSCEALYEMAEAYRWADSLAAAERVVREAMARSGNNAQWRRQLAGILESQGRRDEALGMIREVHGSGDVTLHRASAAIRAGDFTEADRLLREIIDAGSAGHLGGALWQLSISLRYQGRLNEGLTVARRMRRLSERSSREYPLNAVTEAQTLFEMGQWRRAAAIFDSVGRMLHDPDYAGRTARHRAWEFTHVATSVAAIGDTVRLAALADSVEAFGRGSLYGRDPRLHFYVRGLLWRARGRLPEAERAFRQAISSPTNGYSRINLELGRVLLALKRPREAVAVVAPALRGPLDASNLYATHTELHELLAQSYDAAGQADSAAVHWGWVAGAWQDADPMFRDRRDVARARRAALKPRPATKQSGVAG